VTRSAIPPPPPAVLQARLNAMTQPQIERLLDALVAHVKAVRGNPSAGRQVEIDLLEGAYVLVQTVCAQRRAAAQPPPPAADAELTQAVADLTAVMKGP
jgi:hypothetical protein